jgi:hypothetical protein
MPLPYKWNYREDQSSAKRKKLVLSLRVIRTLLVRYCENLTKNEEGLLRIDTFLEKIRGILKNGSDETEQPFGMTNNKKTRLLQD